MSRNLARILLVGVIALGMGGCVAYPAGPGPYYYGGPAYYGPPVAGAVVIGGPGPGWHRGWR
jgi:hypothetical protein